MQTRKTSMANRRIQRGRGAPPPSPSWEDRIGPGAPPSANIAGSPLPNQQAQLPTNERQRSFSANPPCTDPDRGMGGAAKPGHRRCGSSGSNRSGPSTFSGPGVTGAIRPKAQRAAPVSPQLLQQHPRPPSPVHPQSGQVRMSPQQHSQQVPTYSRQPSPQQPHPRQPIPQQQQQQQQHWHSPSPQHHPQQQRQLSPQQMHPQQATQPGDVDNGPNADVIHSLRLALEQSRSRESYLSEELKRITSDNSVSSGAATAGVPSETLQKTPSKQKTVSKQKSSRRGSGSSSGSPKSVMSPRVDEDMPMDEAASQVNALQKELAVKKKEARKRDEESKKNREAMESLKEEARRYREEMEKLRHEMRSMQDQAQALTQMQQRKPIQNSPKRPKNPRMNARGIIVGSPIRSVANSVSSDGEGADSNVSLVNWNVGANGDYATDEDYGRELRSVVSNLETQVGCGEKERTRRPMPKAEDGQDIVMRKLNVMLQTLLLTNSQGGGGSVAQGELSKQRRNEDTTLSSEERSILEQMKGLLHSQRERAMVAVGEVENKLSEVTAALEECIQREEDITAELEGKEALVTELEDELRKVRSEMKDKESEAVSNEIADTYRMAELEREVKKLEEQRDEWKRNEIADTYRISELERELKKAVKGRDNAVEELEAELRAVTEARDELQHEQETIHDEHERSIRAIQRVLADVTTTKDARITELTERLDSFSEEKSALQEELKNLRLSSGAALVSGSMRGESNDEELLARISYLDEELDAIRGALKKSKAAEESVRKEVEQKGGQIVILEQELSKVRSALETAESAKRNELSAIEEKDAKIQVIEEELNTLSTSLEASQARASDLQNNLEDKQAEIADVSTRAEHLKKALEEETAKTESLSDELQQLRNDAARQAAEELNTSQEETGTASQVPAELRMLRKEHTELLAERETMRKDLESKRSSVENAKQIIASLENASGALASDLRAKLKDREAQIAFFREKSAEKQKKVDNLETELGQLQRRNKETESASRQARERLRKQRILHKQLKVAVDELQIATRNGAGKTTMVQQITEVVRNSLGIMSPESEDSEDTDGVFALKEATDKALQQSLQSLAHTVDEFAAEASVVVIDGDVEDLRRQLEVVRSEREAEAKDLKLQLEEKMATVNNLEEAMMTQKLVTESLKVELERKRHEKEEEVFASQSQLQLVRDQLRKTEEELQVFRDGLDNQPVGYISDDESDAESATEAVTSESAQGGGGPNEDTQKMKQQLSTLQQEKDKAEKGLQAEKESLANAKMIISSLERANKSMLEDLRSRLHDSNTAIASLLDKSMQHDKTTSSLRAELEEVRKQSEEDCASHKSEVKKLKDDALVSALRLAAKDREINQLRQAHQLPLLAGSDSKDEGEGEEVTEDELSKLKEPRMTPPPPPPPPPRYTGLVPPPPPPPRETGLVPSSP